LGGIAEEEFLEKEIISALKNFVRHKKVCSSRPTEPGAEAEAEIVLGGRSESPAAVARDGDFSVLLHIAEGGSGSVTVTITSPAANSPGTLMYYSLDGSDPDSQSLL
jgi:hypothetical protein